MGIIQHEALLVTSWMTDVSQKAGAFPESLDECRGHAVRIFGEEIVSEVVHSPWNGYASFFVASSGSKVGWQDAFEHEHRLEIFINWLKDQIYSDGSSPIEWLRISYGERGAEITETNCTNVFV